MKTEVREGFRYAVRSPLLRWMSVGSILFSLLFFSLYLPFSRAVAERYPQPEDLAGFLGLFFALSTAVTLLLSLLVMNRLLSKLGVPTVMMVLPVLYLLAFGVLTVASTFAILLAFRFAQVVWLQGGASSAWEAVINTVPGDRRDRMRAFLYGGPTQVGTVLAGIVALVGERAVSPRVLYGIGLAGRGGGGVFDVPGAEGLRRGAGRRPPRGQTTRVRRDAGGGRALRARPRRRSPPRRSRSGAMSDPDVGVRRVAAEILGDLEAPGAIPALVEGVRDDDPEVRATALRSLARTEAFAASDVVPERLTDPVPEVRLAALDALDALRADRSRARALLRDPDGLVRARAAGILLKDAPGGPEDAGSDPEAETILARLARSPHAEARVAALRALASSRSSMAPDLARTGLSDPTPSVRAEAARTLTTLDPVGGVDDLLAAMAGGGEVLEAADEAMSVSPDRAREDVQRLAAASTSQALEQPTTRGLDRDQAVTTGSAAPRLPPRRVPGRRRDRDPGRRPAGRPRCDLHRAREPLRARTPRSAPNALEVIETTGDPDLVRSLLASLEDRHVYRSSIASWRDGAIHHPDEWVRRCAEWAIAAGEAPEEEEGEPGEGEGQGGTMTETLTTLPLMERVLFLRRVALFADLPPQDLAPIAAIASERSYADADTIAEQDEPGDEMHIIVSGYVMVILRQPGGHQQVLAVRSTGDVIGEMAVITSAPRMASLAAKGPVRLLSIGRRQFESMLRDRPETALALMRVLCQRLADRDTAVPD